MSALTCLFFAESALCEQGSFDELMFCSTCNRALELVRGEKRQFVVACLACDTRKTCNEWATATGKQFKERGNPCNETCVLFVAHDGVHHPEIWELWAEGRDNVRFAVLCDDEPTHHSEFCRDHRLMGAHENSHGGADTLDWIVGGIGWLIRRTQVEWIIVVSGTAIPIRSFDNFATNLMFDSTSKMNVFDMNQPYEVEHLRRGPCVSPCACLSVWMDGCFAPGQCPSSRSFIARKACWC